MACERLEGFEFSADNTDLNRKWDALSEASGTGPGRYGGNSLNIQNANITMTLPAVATRIVGFAYRQDFSLRNMVLFSFFDTGTTQCDMRITDTGHITFTRNGTVLGTSTTTIQPNDWHYYEIKATIGASASYEVRLDSTTTISGTGNTQNTANSTTNQINFQAPNDNTPYLDDVYIFNTSGSVNNDFAGESKVLGDTVTGDGTHTDFNTSAGSDHFALVNDYPADDDATYISGGTIGNIDTFTFAPVTLSGNVIALQTTIMARKDDVSVRQISEICRSGGTDYTGANTFTLLSNYESYIQARDVDPDTSTAWTNLGINDVELGVKVIA